jgi:hypothetical protein
MNEKNIVYYIVICIIVAAVFFTIGRFIQPGAAIVDGNGGSTNKLTKQLRESESRIRDLESRLVSIHLTSERITESLIDSLERSRDTIDHIEKLRIILKTIQDSFNDLGRISSLSGGRSSD